MSGAGLQLSLSLSCARGSLACTVIAYFSAAPCPALPCPAWLPRIVRGVFFYSFFHKYLLESHRKCESPVASLCVCVSSSSCVVVFFLRPPLGLGLESCVWLALTLFTLDRCQLAALPLPLPLLLLLALPCSLYCCLCAVLLLFM